MASVGVGAGVFKSELEDIATDAGHILMYDNYDRLTTFAHEIISLIGKDCKDMNANKGISAIRRHIAPMNRPLEEVKYCFRRVRTAVKNLSPKSFYTTTFIPRQSLGM